MNTKLCVEVANQAMAEIHAHFKHSGHNLGSEGDKNFSPIHLLVFSFATKNLKMIVSSSNIIVAPLKETIFFENMVTYFEQVIFSFFLLL
jgi:hypothetical protein